MNVEFDRSFEKALQKLNNHSVLRKIKSIIIQLETASSLNQIKNIKKMQGFKSYYRIKFGDYRLGLELTDTNSITLITVAHRKDIYKVFP
jgi:mRNA interferase RelE/StbE